MIEIVEYPYKMKVKDHWFHEDKRICSYCGKYKYHIKRYKFDGVVTVLCESCRKRRIIKKLIKMQGQ